MLGAVAASLLWGVRKEKRVRRFDRSLSGASLAMQPPAVFTWSAPEARNLCAHRLSSVPNPAQTHSRRRDTQRGTQLQKYRQYVQHTIHLPLPSPRPCPWRLQRLDEQCPPRSSFVFHLPKKTCEAFHPSFGRPSSEWLVCSYRRTRYCRMCTMHPCCGRWDSRLRKTVLGLRWRVTGAIRIPSGQQLVLQTL